jgi:hypothetical protein
MTSVSNDNESADARRNPGLLVDAALAGYMDCFNRGLYFEAHEVLEKLWLPQRQGPNGLFLKGLIQFAGAFVHVQKGRAAPAISLLRLADRCLSTYPGIHCRVQVAVVRNQIRDWLRSIESAQGPVSALFEGRQPMITLDEARSERKQDQK